MSKPMYCPMSFVGYLGEQTSLLVECTPDCAWAVISEKQDAYFCVMATRFLDVTSYGINSRQLKDDAE